MAMQTRLTSRRLAKERSGVSYTKTSVHCECMVMAAANDNCMAAANDHWMAFRRTSMGVPTWRLCVSLSWFDEVEPAAAAARLAAKVVGGISEAAPAPAAPW